MTASKNESPKKLKKGYIIELWKKSIESASVKFYFENVLAAGPDVEFGYPKKNPRTLVYLADTADEGEAIDNKALFFEDKIDAEDLVELLGAYQDYDEKLCGPFVEGCKLAFKIVETEAYNEYSMYGGMPYLLSLDRDEDKFKYLSDLFEEIYFKDIDDQDKAKKWLDENVKEKENA